jgi:hypothetical protein
MLTTNFDAYVHGPIRTFITTAGAYGVTINLADANKSMLPEWAQSMVNIIMSFPYMGAFSSIAVILLILERFYSIRIRRLEIKRLKQQIKRGEV